MILGISGKMGAGKDTIADVLVSKHGFTKLSFATAIKEICSNVFNIDSNYFYDRVLKDKAFDSSIKLTYDNLNSLCDEIIKEGYGVSKDLRESVLKKGVDNQMTSPRVLLQYIGTDLCRNIIGPDIWLTITKYKINKSKTDVVIPDCRFPNERLLIKELDGLTALVNRPKLDLLYTNDNTTHISENLLGIEEDYDIVFNNTGSQGILEEDVYMWYEYRR